MKNSKKGKLPENVRNAIALAVIQADFDDPGNRCALDDKTKRAMQPFLRQTVVSALDEVLAWDQGDIEARDISSCSPFSTQAMKSRVRRIRYAGLRVKGMPIPEDDTEDNRV